MLLGISTIENYLIISDLQIPFEHEHALDFCLKVQKEFKIPKQNIINIGDELDQYTFSRFPKDPDADISISSELRESRKRLKDWIKAFPSMRVCTSNHGLRIFARSQESGLPSEILKPYKEIFELPREWIYKDEWIIKTKKPFKCIHGMGYGGILGHRNAVIDARMSVCIGHLHSHGGVNYVNNGNETLWGMNVGSLIAEEKFAFKYGKYSRNKSIISTGVVLNDGMLPVLIPYGSL